MRCETEDVDMSQSSISIFRQTNLSHHVTLPASTGIVFSHQHRVISKKIQISQDIDNGASRDQTRLWGEYVEHVDVLIPSGTIWLCNL